MNYSQGTAAAFKSENQFEPSNFPVYFLQNLLVMSQMSISGDPIDIEKEADKTVAIANKVIDVLPSILNGSLKLSKSPEFCNLTLTYALYGKLVDNLKYQQVKQSNILPVVLKFLFPDLAQFLPQSILVLTTQVRRFINKAYRLGQLLSLYQPVSKLYTAKENSEWTDFKKWGVTQDMLVTGPLVPASGCQMQLTNRHVILLLNLRNKHRLCWVKVVPQWLRFFGILQLDDCVQLQDIKGHWVGLSQQVNNMNGIELKKFLDTPYTLPKSFIKKNIDSIPLKVPHIKKKKYKTACLRENQKQVESLQKELNKLKSQMVSKDKEISAYQKQLSQTENRLEHLATRLSKMRLVKNHWLMKYRSMSGINLFAEDFEFNADMAYVKKIREGARYIKRIIQLRYSDGSSPFVESFLEDGFIEELLEKILMHDISFDKSSNILSEILQELAKHSQGKFIDTSKRQENKNKSDDLLMNNRKVPQENKSFPTDDVIELSDSDSSLFGDTIERSQPINITCTDSVNQANKHVKPDGFSSKENCQKILNNKNLNIETPNHLANSSKYNQNEYWQSLSSKDCISGLCKDEEMLNNAYILYDMVTHKRTHDASEERSRDSGHASHEDANAYQPDTKILRLDTPKNSLPINSDPGYSNDSSLSPLLLEDDRCDSVPFSFTEYLTDANSKPPKDNPDFLLNNPNDNNAESLKSKNDLALNDTYDNSLESNWILEPNFIDIEDAQSATLKNTISSSSLPLLPPPPCLDLTNFKSHLQTLDDQMSQENLLNPEMNSSSCKLSQDRTISSSKIPLLLQD